MPPSIYSLNSIIQGAVHLSSPQRFNDPFDSYLCVKKESFEKEYLIRKLVQGEYVKEIENSDEFITNKELDNLYNTYCEGESGYYYKPSFYSTFYDIANYKSESFRRLYMGFYNEAHKSCTTKMKFLRNTVYRISCFSHFMNESELMENSTMWSHYADEHKGFCVKYTLDFGKTKFRDILLCSLFKVKYTSRTEFITNNQLLSLNDKDGELYINDAVKKKTN